jgi:hypothetical protein
MCTFVSSRDQSTHLSLSATERAAHAKSLYLPTGPTRADGPRIYIGLAVGTQMVAIASGNLSIYCACLVSHSMAGSGLHQLISTVS